MSIPFNPLDIENLAHSIVTRMEETDATPLGEVPAFFGAGVYAIYYRGSFDAYAALSALNKTSWACPIYVGKAVPQGGRRGIEIVNHTNTQALSKRLSEHAASIRSAHNLDINDFAARWLVVQDIWIALGESAMIRGNKPVWNAVVDGFGNHNPGRGRINGKRSLWDTLHPGRPWAANFPQRDEQPEQITQMITKHFDPGLF